jgi:hypothetical protein
MGVSIGLSKYFFPQTIGGGTLNWHTRFSPWWHLFVFVLFFVGF